MTDITTSIEQYFSYLFSSSPRNPYALHQVLDHVQRRLSDDACAVLDAPFKEDEVKEAVFNSGAIKAPGPEEFQGVFYQKIWSVVGP